MYILGINAYHGDCSACLLKDAMLLFAAEKKGFKRFKHRSGFTTQAIVFI